MHKRINSVVYYSGKYFSETCGTENQTSNTSNNISEQKKVVNFGTGIELARKNAPPVAGVRNKNGSNEHVSVYAASGHPIVMLLTASDRPVITECSLHLISP